MYNLLNKKLYFTVMLYKNLPQPPVLYIAVLESIRNSLSYLRIPCQDLLVRIWYQYKLKLNPNGIQVEQQLNYQLKFK